MPGTYSLCKLTVGSLFSGIGGLDLGMERAGFEIVWQCEIDPFCQKILRKHWPNVRMYDDVKEIGRTNTIRPDVIMGGFPCQPYSVAGKRKGAEDDRNLWPEFLRIIEELRPAWVIAENVLGIISLYLDVVLADLEGKGYTCWTFDIPACAFGAWHKRSRIFVVAYTDTGFDAQAPAPLRPKVVSDASSKGLEGQGIHRPTTYGTGWLPEPDLVRVVYGLPDGLDKDRIRALGNAVVPQVAEWIGRQILDCHQGD